MEAKFIPRDKIHPWIGKMAEERGVLLPVRQGDVVTYRAWRPGSEAELDVAPGMSPKESVFPQTETLLTYRQIKAEEGVEARFEINETLPQEKVVVFGARPCGARGLLVFDKVFDCEKIRDAYYATRRENTAYISIACTSPEPTCFCTAVGGGPGDPSGSDIMLYPLDRDFVAQAESERGAELLRLGGFEDAGSGAVQARALVDEAAGKMEGRWELEGFSEKFQSLFENSEFWEEQSAKCLSCGTCAYLCPTCHCFNITDEGSEGQGRRVRTWDNCMSFNFTLEGSGHNPRTNKAMRLRNRVGHKFAYYPKLHEELIACCGCGRCITACPSCMDIRGIVKAVQEYDNDLQ